MITGLSAVDVKPITLVDPYLLCGTWTPPACKAVRNLVALFLAFVFGCIAVAAVSPLTEQREYK
jgi:hypothetical protein